MKEIGAVPQEVTRKEIARVPLAACFASTVSPRVILILANTGYGEDGHDFLLRLPDKWHCTDAILLEGVLSFSWIQLDIRQSWRFLYSCWTPFQQIARGLSSRSWHGVVVYREHMAGLLTSDFNRISIMMQLVESATTWCAGSQGDIPVTILISVLAWATKRLLLSANSPHCEMSF